MDLLSRERSRVQVIGFERWDTPPTGLKDLGVVQLECSDCSTTEFGMLLG
jgi:hypothetical protein